MSRNNNRGIRRYSRDAAHVVGASYAAQVLTLFLAVLLRRELEPFEIGYIAITQLAASYAPYVGLGVPQAAEREIAVELGRERHGHVAELERGSFRISVALAAAVAVCAALAGAYFSHAQPVLAATLIAASAIIVAQQVAVAATIRLRTRQLFTRLGWVAALGTVTASGSVLMGAIAAGVTGAIAGAVIGSVGQAIVFTVAAHSAPERRGRAARARPAARQTARLARLAPVFWLLGLSAVVFYTIDQLAVGYFLGTTALGLYSTAYLGTAFLVRIPTVVNSILSVRLQTDFGASANEVRVFLVATRVTALSTILTPLLVAIALIALPILIATFLPAFSSSIGAMRILLLSVLGLALAMPASQYLIAVGLQWEVVKLTAGGVALLGSTYATLGFTGGLTIELAAIADVVVYYLYGVAVQLAAHRAARRPLGAVISPAAVTALMIAGLWAASSLAPSYGSMGIAPLIHGVLSLVVCGIVASSFLVIDTQARADLASVLRKSRL